MVNSLNKVTLIGRLGKDPDIRMMQDSKQLATFSIATSESWIDKNTNERVEKTEWHNIVVFNEKLVQISQKNLKKGTKVYIEGALKTRKWRDGNGNERYITEVVLQQFNSVLIILDYEKPSQNLDNKEKNNLEKEELNKNNNTQELEEIDDDEIPF